MRRFLIALTLLLVVLGSGNLFAQATASATLQGTVLDKSGAVIPNAEVKVTSKDNGSVRTATSGAEGTYRFDLLSAGTYEVRITSKGFATAAYEGVELSVGRTTTIDASLTPSQQAEVITVEASGAALVDVQKTDVSRPITQTDIQELPLNGRDFMNLAVLAPGAKAVDSYDPTKNRIGVFATNGSSGRNVNVTVNGIDNKDNTVGGPVMQLPLEAIQEFNISTQRFSAANGRSEGAAVNVITKSGGNDFHGSAYFFGRNESLNTKNALEDEKAPFLRQQFGGSIGGPVKKDKTFLFFALERTREETSISVDPSAFKELSLVKSLGANPASVIPTPYYDWRYNGRLDHRFNEKNNLVLSYSNQNNTGQNDQSGSLNDLTAGNFTTNQLIIANATLNTVISPTTVNAVTIGYQYWNNLIDTANKVPTFNFPGGITFGTNVNVPQQSYQKKWQFKDDLSLTKGKHTLKMGFDFLNEPKVGGFFVSNPTINFTFFDLPSVILSDKKNYPQGFATPGAVQSISDTAGNPYFNLAPKMFGLYFQDDWKLSRRLTVSLGVRWDRDYDLNGGPEQGQARAYLALKAINSPYAYKLPGDDKKDFSPRIGLAYDLTGQGKHVLRAGYGIYFGQTFQNIPLFMLQQTNSTLFTSVNLNSNGPDDTTADIVPSTGKPLSQFRYGVDPNPGKPAASTKLAAGDSSNIMDPNYRNPYSEQFNAGYSWSITDNSVFEAEYIHVLGLHENKNVVINPKLLIELGGARPTDAPFKAAGLPVLGRITDSQSTSRSRYDGMNLSYRRRMSKHFSVNTSYVLSRGLAYNGAAASYSIRPSDLRHIYGSQDIGPVPSDERHRFVFSGLLALPWGIKFSPIMQWASARPYNVTQGISDVWGFGGGQGATHAILLKSDPNNFLATKAYNASQLRSCLGTGDCFQASYDAARGQVFFQLDSRVSKDIKFGEKRVLNVFFQAFDMTNRANYGNNFTGNIRSGTFGKPNAFITPSGVIVPRSFSGELGATFRF